jgi:glyceraldehyde-3-phosphate dehydrogenase (NADP+)
MRAFHSPALCCSDEIVIGQYAMVDAPTALEALDAALKAYDHGRGAWARMKAGERIAHVKKFGQAMKNKREELAHILMWEICKSRADAEKEVDRTVQYITDTIAELTKMENQTNGVVVEQGIVSQTKRSPLGVALVAAPQNYPLK